jgi:hypothetical protein
VEVHQVRPDPPAQAHRRPRTSLGPGSLTAGRYVTAIPCQSTKLRRAAKQRGGSVTALGRPSTLGTSATAVPPGFDIAQGARGRSGAPASGSQGSARNPGRSRHGAPGSKHRFLPSPSALAPPPGGPDNGPLSRPLVVAIRAARVSRTWPGVRRWTGGGVRAHPESVSERVKIACRDLGRAMGVRD